MYVLGRKGGPKRTGEPADAFSGKPEPEEASTSAGSTTSPRVGSVQARPEQVLSFIEGLPKDQFEIGLQ